MFPISTPVHLQKLLDFGFQMNQRCWRRPRRWRLGYLLCRLICWFVAWDALWPGIQWRLIPFGTNLPSLYRFYPYYMGGLYHWSVCSKNGNFSRLTSLPHSLFFFITPTYWRYVTDLSQTRALWLCWWCQCTSLWENYGGRLSNTRGYSWEIRKMG